MANLYRFGITLALLIGGAGLVCGQETAPIKCHSAEKVKGAPKYQIAQTSRTVEPEPTQLIFISIQPEYFNRQDLIMLAEQLKRDFCKEQKLGVFLFSDYRAAKQFTGDDNTPQIYWKAFRGSYQLDRDTGEEYISFSQDPDKPIERVKIMLSGNTSP